MSLLKLIRDLSSDTGNYRPLSVLEQLVGSYAAEDHSGDSRIAVSPGEFFEGYSINGSNATVSELLWAGIITWDLDGKVTLGTGGQWLLESTTEGQLPRATINTPVGTPVLYEVSGASLKEYRCARIGQHYAAGEFSVGDNVFEAHVQAFVGKDTAMTCFEYTELILLPAPEKVAAS